MSAYAEAEYLSWFEPVCCSCCDRSKNVSIAPLMSSIYPVCKVCYSIWYDTGTTNPEVLREKSLGPEGQKWLDSWKQGEKKP